MSYMQCQLISYLSNTFKLIFILLVSLQIISTVTNYSLGNKTAFTQNISTLPRPMSIFEDNQQPIKSEEVNETKILLWISPQIKEYRHERLNLLKKLVNGQDCFKECRMSVGKSKSDADGADAILFFMFNIGFKRKELPKRLNRKQIWIYNQGEPPPYFSPAKYFNHQFNWTMTYRHDSDIHSPYGRKLPFPEASQLQYFGDDHVSLQEWIKGKQHLATVATSNCKTASKREKIFKKLEDIGIPIQYYGECSKNKVFCFKYAPNCTDYWRDISAKHKFYLAFENSLCSDYITEKFWRSLYLGMVPVVYGRGNYVDAAPPNSYIDIRDFSTPEELKDHLQMLDKNPEEYSKYFEWRKEFKFQNEFKAYCDICSELKEHRRRGYEEGGIGMEKIGQQVEGFSKVYANLTGWFGMEPGQPNRPACISPEEMGMARFLN